MKLGYYWTNLLLTGPKLTTKNIYFVNKRRDGRLLVFCKALTV